MTLRHHIQAAGGDLAAAAQTYRSEHGRLPRTQEWSRAGVEAPVGGVAPRGGRKPSTNEGALVPVTVKLRPSTLARLEIAYPGLTAGGAIKRLVEGVADALSLTDEQAARAAQAAEALGGAAVVEALDAPRR